MKAYVRFKQVLCLLKQHGPLSFRTLHAMIEPKIAEDNLHQVLRRMKKMDLLSIRHERLFRGMGVFYRLPVDKDPRRKVAELIGCKPDDLLQPYFQRRELLHSQLCARWSFYFTKTYPSLEQLRDFEIERNSEALDVLIYTAGEKDFIPDLLLVDRTTSTRPIFIAVEVERTLKSKLRLALKLKKYAAGSHIDGLIFLCDSDYLQHTAQTIYRTRVIEKAHRLGLSRENFLLLGNDIEEPSIAAQKMYNCELHATSLKDWMEKLCTGLRKNESATKSKLNQSPD